MSAGSPDTTQPNIVQGDSIRHDSLAAKPVRPKRRWFGFSEVSISKPESSQVSAGGNIQPIPRKSLSSQDFAAHDNFQAEPQNTSPVSEAEVPPLLANELQKATINDDENLLGEHQADKDLTTTTAASVEHNERNTHTPEDAVGTEDSLQTIPLEDNRQSGSEVQAKPHPDSMTASPASVIYVPANSAQTQTGSHAISMANVVHKSISAPSALPRDVVSDEPEQPLFGQRVSVDGFKHDELMSASPDSITAETTIPDRQAVTVDTDVPSEAVADPNEAALEPPLSSLPILLLPDGELSATVVQTLDTPIIVVPPSDTKGSGIVLTNVPANDPLTTTLCEEVPHSNLPRIDTSTADLPKVGLSDTDALASLKHNSSSGVSETIVADLPGYGAPNADLPAPKLPDPNDAVLGLPGSGLQNMLPTDNKPSDISFIKKTRLVDDIRKVIVRKQLLQLLLGKELSRVTHAQLKNASGVTNVVPA